MTPSDNAASDAETDSEPTSSSYAEAVEELEAILADLDDEAIDVDVLAQKVERAAALIGFCRERIGAASVQVEKIVADLESVSGDGN